jgi:hypothetical protein
MALYPDAFKKGQEEVDRVIGHDRLPSILDRDQLPYVNALMLEILRWCVATPLGLFLTFHLVGILVSNLKYGLGVPHKSWQDDTHNGYFIPKGTVILANIQ